MVLEQKPARKQGAPNRCCYRGCAHQTKVTLPINTKVEPLVCGDKGYSSGKIRAYLRRRGIGYTIPRKSNERRNGPFNRALYQMRNLVERAINRLKQFRRIATRYEKKAENYLAMLHIASILLWL